MTNVRAAGFEALNRGDPLAAAPLLHAAVAAEPGDGAAWLALSRAQLECADLSGAWLSATTACAKDSASAEAALHLAAVELRRGDRDAAGRVLATFAARAGEDPVRLSPILDRLLELRDWTRAGEIGLAMRAAQPDDERAVFSIAAALQAAGDLAGAREMAGSLGEDAAVRIAIRLLLAEHAPLDAWALTQATADHLLTSRTIEQVARDLLAAGHLSPAAAAAGRALLLDDGNHAARRLLDVARGRRAALLGTFPPPAIEARAWEPIPGRALLVAAASAPRVLNGGTVRTQEIARTLAAFGIDEHVVTNPGFPWSQGWLSDPPEELVDGVHHHRLRPPTVEWTAARGIDLPALRAGMPARDDALVTLIAEQIATVAHEVRPAVLHATRAPLYAEASLLAGRALGLPTVCEVRDWSDRLWLTGDPARSGKSEQMGLLFDQDTRCMAAADHVVVVTDVMREEAIARGIPEDRITVVPIAIDIGAIRPMEPDPDLRANLRIPSGDVVIGHLSSLASYEGVGDLIDAFARLVGEGAAATLLVVGDSRERPVLVARAAAAGVADAVRFAGRVPHEEVVRWYALMDVIVIPRRVTPATIMLEPSKLTEAMATGKPVVASGVPPIRAVLVNGETGVLTPPGSPAALARALSGLIGDPARRQRIGMAGREWIVANRELSTEAGKLAGVLVEAESTIGPRAGRDGVASLAAARREPRRILHLVENTGPWELSGSTVRTSEILRWQREAGIEPHVATLLGNPWRGGAARAPLMETVDGIPHYRIAPGIRGWNGKVELEREAVIARMPATVDERRTMQDTVLRRLVRTIAPQAIHGATSIDAMAAAVRVAGPMGLPVIVEVRGFHEWIWLSADASRTPDDAGFTSRRTRATEQMLAADRVVTLSEGMAREIAGRGIPMERIHVVPNAVDPERFRPRPRNAALGASVGIGPQAFVLGAITTLSRWEGLEALLDAVAILRREGAPAVALLVGGGEMADRLGQRAADLGLGSAAVLTGQVPWEEVPQWYSLIDVFAAPRRDLPFTRLVTPLKPYEAMAMERAVIVSDLPALREMVVEGVNGLFMRPGDAEDLADIARGLMTDPARRRDLGRSAREWVIANRAWVDNGRRYLELYRELGLDMT